MTALRSTPEPDRLWHGTIRALQFSPGEPTLAARRTPIGRSILRQLPHIVTRHCMISMRLNSGQRPDDSMTCLQSDREGRPSAK